MLQARARTSQPPTSYGCPTLLPIASVERGQHVVDAILFDRS